MDGWMDGPLPPTRGCRAPNHCILPAVFQMVCDQLNLENVRPDGSEFRINSFELGPTDCEVCAKVCDAALADVQGQK